MTKLKTGTTLPWHSGIKSAIEDELVMNADNLEYYSTNRQNTKMLTNGIGKPAEYLRNSGMYLGSLEPMDNLA